MKNNKLKKLENKNGITLIALVVTIVVLLILAGVSISLILDNNGVIQKSKDAKREYEQAKENEQADLNNVPDWIETAVRKIAYNEELKALKSGDYIIYDTGIEGVGEVTCRVLYDAESPYNLQIITDDCIKKDGEYVYIPFGDIYLLKYYSSNPGKSTEFDEKLKDYDFSEWYQYDEKADEEYNNAISILNSEAMKFCNDIYIADARCVGSNPINKEKETKKNAEIPTEVIDEQEENGWEVSEKDTGVKDEDDNYETDYNTLQSLNILTVNKHYWFASRYNEIAPTYRNYKGLVFNLRNDESNEFVYGKSRILEAIGYGGGGYSGGTDVTGLIINALRPVFTLKGDLKVVSGDGTSESTAYRLGV